MEAPKRPSKSFLATSEEDARSFGRYRLALIPLHQGKMDEALDVLDQDMAGDEMEGYELTGYLRKLFSKSSISAEKGDLDRAVAEYEKLLSIHIGSRKA